jgi:hypothetical protein
MDYTITISNAQKIALEYIAADVQEWISNAANARAQIAITDITSKLISHCNANNIALAVGEEAQMQQAKDLGLLEVTQLQSEN